MKILINASKNYTGGGLQVAISFIKECVNYPQNLYYVLVGPTVSIEIKEYHFPDNFIFYYIPKKKFHKYASCLSKYESLVQPDIVFSIFGPTYWRPRAKHIMGYAMGHYIYPDSPFWNISSIWSRLIWKIKEKIHIYFFSRDADVFIVETEDACIRLKNKIKKPCYVVSNTYSKSFLDFTTNDNYIKQLILPIRKDKEYRLLSICGSYPHKNLSIIPKVIDCLKSSGYFSFRFVLTIPLYDYEKLFPEKYRFDVINIGPISPSLAPQLYSECDVSFVPSLLECFTANFPESMIMKKPILASDLGFSHTICKDAALYFDPTDPENIANTIIQLYNNNNLSSQLIKNGIRRVSQFNLPEERALSYLEICSIYKK